MNKLGVTRSRCRRHPTYNKTWRLLTHLFCFFWIFFFSIISCFLVTEYETETRTDGNKKNVCPLECAQRADSTKETILIMDVRAHLNKHYN